MTSRNGGARFARRWFFAGAAATLLAATGARAEEGTEDLAMKAGAANVARVTPADPGTGSAAAADVPDCRCRNAIGPATVVDPGRQGAKPAADRGRGDYDEAREIASGNSGGRG
jgi:hypothetical protein